MSLRQVYNTMLKRSLVTIHFTCSKHDKLVEYRQSAYVLEVT